MPLVRERKVFVQGLRVLAKVDGRVLPSHIFHAATAMALLCESEDFSTYPDQYVTSAADLAFLSDFRAKTLAPFLTDFEQKKALRPLIDAIDKAKRQNRFK